MARFSKAEIEYLKSQRVARIATVSAKGQPDVVPVVLEFDGEYFWVGSHGDKARKYRNVNSGNKLVALVIDDVESYETWKVRQLRVYGTADIIDHNGLLERGKYLRIAPRISWSWLGASDKKESGHDRGPVRTVHG